MDIKKCDFCLNEFALASDPMHGFCEVKFSRASGSYTIDKSNRLNRFVVTKKCLLSDKEQRIDICDNCLMKLFGKGKINSSGILGYIKL